MRWGIALNVRDKISETLRKAEIADKGGIEQVWVTDFPAERYAPAVAAAIAENTSSCRIGVGLMSTLLYSSTHMIQFMSTLIDNYGERFDLLIGPGDRNALASVGVETTTKMMVDRTTITLEEIKIGLSKAGHQSSILLGAQGPTMIKASLKADGVLLNYSDVEMLRWALKQIELIPKGFQLGIFPPTYVGNCQDIMSNQAISLSAAMVAIGLSRNVSDLFGLNSKIDIARSLMNEKGRIDMEIPKSLGIDVIKRFAFCGTSKQLSEYLKTIKSLGISSVVFGPPQGIRSNGVEILVDAKSHE